MATVVYEGKIASSDRVNAIVIVIVDRTRCCFVMSAIGDITVSVLDSSRYLWVSKYTHYTLIMSAALTRAKEQNCVESFFIYHHIECSRLCWSKKNTGRCHIGSITSRCSGNEPRARRLKSGLVVT